MKESSYKVSKPIQIYRPAGLTKNTESPICGSTNCKGSKSKHNHVEDEVSSAIFRSLITTPQPRFSFSDKDCFYCKRVNLRKLFQDGPPAYSIVDPSKLASLKHIQRRTRCPSCRPISVLIQRLIEANPMLSKARWSLSAIGIDDILFGDLRNTFNPCLNMYSVNGNPLSKKTSICLGVRTVGFGGISSSPHLQSIALFEERKLTGS